MQLIWYIGELLFTLCMSVSSHIYLDPSLTVDSLSSVLDTVQDLNGVVDQLHIPSSKQAELAQQYDKKQHNRAFAAYFLTHHAAPSWRVIALALWQTGELKALESVQKLYYKGEPRANKAVKFAIAENHPYRASGIL